MDTVGGVLKTLRERMAVSQEVVSAKAGLSETYYGKIESGKRRPDARVLLRLLRILNASRPEEQTAVRLFMSNRFPMEMLEVLATMDPLQGTARVSAVPSPKRRRVRRGLRAWWLVPAVSATLLGQPLRVDAARRIMDDTQVRHSRGILPPWRRKVA